MKRHIAAWLLLAVYVPMLLLSSLHFHEPSQEMEPTCTECVGHQCHGHLIQLSGGMHQCVLCQILTLTYIVVATRGLLCYQARRKAVYAVCRRDVCRVSRCNISLRAPPAIWKHKMLFSHLHGFSNRESYRQTLILTAMLMLCSRGYVIIIQQTGVLGIWNTLLYI